jgi:Arc/MetJ-type ribon-helix-helix transcriptional regulator
MKRMIITIDDETAKVLAKHPNQSEIVRQALKLYQEDITTDTLAGIKEAFRIMLKRIDKTDALIRDRLPKVGDKAEPRVEPGDWGA